MTLQLTEGRLRFEFPEKWKAARYDEWTFYRKQFSKLRNGIKAIDFLVVEPSGTVWLIEVKDYRQKRRTKPSHIADEVAEKVFDTLAALLPASINANDDAEKTFARHVLADRPNRRLRAVLHLEQPAKHSKLFPQAIDPADVNQRLKRLLRPIDPHPLVTEIRSGKHLGWKTTST